MQLTGQRIKLSPLDNSDLTLFIEISMCPNMMKHVYEILSYEEAKEAFDTKSKPWTLESNDWLTLGITEIISGDKLGSIGLKIINHDARIAEVGFMIKQTAQGKGFAGEALNLIKQYAYSELDLNKLVAICSVKNSGSYKLLEKTGFIREGCLKQNTLIKNELVDDYIYGLCSPFEKQEIN